jgi:hypothetical protein
MAISAGWWGSANIPRRRPIISLCGVMPPFTMTTHEKHLVFNIVGTLEIQFRDQVIESLPLGQMLLRIMFTVGIIGSVDKAKINRGLIVISLLEFPYMSF